MPQPHPLADCISRYSWCISRRHRPPWSQTGCVFNSERLKFAPSTTHHPKKEFAMFPLSQRKVRRIFAGVSVAIALSSNAWAISEAQFQPAFDQFMQANQGNEAAIDAAATAFGALVQQEPTNPVLLAYAGAATSMRANTTFLPWKKMNYSEDGLALLDKSLAMLTASHSAPLQHGVPAVMEVRFVAASTFLGVPGFMNRGARGTKLLNELLSDPLLASAPLGFQGGVWMKAATVAARDKRPDDARKYFNAVIKANAPQADAARAQLSAMAS
jgi:hypothetical protein